MTLQRIISNQQRREGSSAWRPLGMAADDEEDYVFYGTPIEEEEETRAGQRRKEVKDPALTKQLPLHKQVPAPTPAQCRWNMAGTVMP